LICFNSNNPAINLIGLFGLDKRGQNNKSFNQITDIDNSFVVANDIEIGFKNKIPLWLFGFLY
jgi:hypothetical protein